jgi:hypothetical protein
VVPQVAACEAHEKGNEHSGRRRINGSNPGIRAGSFATVVTATLEHPRFHTVWTPNGYPGCGNRCTRIDADTALSRYPRFD